MDGRSLVLASASPRRAQILSQAGYDFAIRVSDVEEIEPADGVSWRAVAENARRKAVAVAAASPNAGREVVLGADTILVLEDRWIGKPADRAAGVQMLSSLAGRRHRVATAVCLVSPAGEQSLIDETVVHIRALTRDAIAEYHRTVDPLDKAGAYNIDEHGSLEGGVVQSIDGSYANVMGLPIERLEPMLAALGIESSERAGGGVE